MSETETRPTDESIWMRLLFIILFGVIYGVAEIVVCAVVVLQFGFVLFTDKRNSGLLEFGTNVSDFIYQILLYVTFNSDHKPFPFSDWPQSNPRSNKPQI